MPKGTLLLAVAFYLTCASSQASQLVLPAPSLILIEQTQTPTDDTDPKKQTPPQSTDVQAEEKQTEAQIQEQEDAEPVEKPQALDATSEALDSLKQTQEKDSSGLKSASATQEDIEFVSDGQLHAFEEEFDQLYDKVVALSRSPEDYSELYSRIRPVILEKTAKLKAQLASSPNLTLMAQVNNYETFQQLVYQYAELKNYFYCVRIYSQRLLMHL